MRIYFLGIGGTAIGPLAMIAKQAGYQVFGSDKQHSSYISNLENNGIDQVHIGDDADFIKNVHSKQPIDWLVTSSAVLIENPDSPILSFAKNNNVRVSKRDELINQIITKNNLKLIAISGTHGKTTTTAMAIWLLKQLGIPVSYSVGAKISFSEMGAYDENSEYFVYEADEFDRNFLSFQPYISLISGIDYDHHEIFPTLDNYQEAFLEFTNQSQRTVLWADDAEKIKFKKRENDLILESNSTIDSSTSLLGAVNRKNAWLVAAGLNKNALGPKDLSESLKLLDKFPGLSRRFEKITNNLYSDYAHTVPKIEGCLQMAQETGKKLVVVYEPLTDRRQHYIKDEYKSLFKDVSKLYWVPSYLAREDPKQKIIKPQEFIDIMDNKGIAEPAELNEVLKENIQKHLDSDELVVCLSGGGGNSLDEWLRNNFLNTNGS